MTELGKPKFFYGYVIVLAGFLIMLISWGTILAFGVFLKPVSTELGWTRAVTTGAYSAFFLLQGLLSIVTGRLNDRSGPRLIMTVSGFLLGLGYLLMSQVSAVWQLYLFYGVIMGVGAAGIFVPAVSTVARWFVKRRGLMTGIVLSGVGVGITIMPPIANWLISTYGWRISYIVIGIIALVFIIGSAQFLRHEPGQMGRMAYGESEVKRESLNLQVSGFSFQQALRTRQFWMLCALFICHLFGQQVILIHIVPHATDIGISTVIATNILAIIGGLSIAGMMAMSGVGDRIGNKPALIIVFILVSIALFWLLVAREVWMLYLFAIVFGLGFGGVVALESPIVAELFGLRAHGVILGIVVAAFTVGGAIGALMAGRVFDITTSYWLAFLTSGVLSVIGLILVSLLKPTAVAEKQITGEEAPTL